jgi:hypothetical protein
MKNEFRINYRKSCGNLHVRPEGAFNGMCAWALIKTIKKHYNGHGRVFVETALLIEVLPDGVVLFKKYMPSQMRQIDRLFIKGKKGFKIGPNGCRVLICKPHKKNPVFRRFKPVLRIAHNPENR